MSLLILFLPCLGGVPCPRNDQSDAIYRVPPCLSDAPRPRSYQSVTIYRGPPHAQVVFPDLEVTKMSLFIVRPAPCPVGVLRPGSYESVAICCVPTLPRWCSPPLEWQGVATDKTTHCVIRSFRGRGLWLGGKSNHSTNQSANQSITQSIDQSNKQNCPPQNHSRDHVGYLWVTCQSPR